ncbi:SDR family NAD(P)-dependent oxidoreductase [Nocardioides sp. NPDC057577]|uniref:SDR family NAD(P)-dependent oxidoreductase n=1 Tax=Nocardioides sp. NPDC057577 TaxID=3346171 RepID=UPI00367074B9
MTAEAPTIVVTGATGGLGALATTSLAATGARLILVARSAERAEQTISSLRDSTSVEPEVFLADLSRPAEVRRAGEEIRSRHERIDVLINNAGLHAFEPRLTDDGLPEMVAVNYLAPFVLTRELLPSLLRSPAGRVVNVASEASRRHGDFRIPDVLTDTSPFTARGSSERYGQSKLLDIMFTLTLARRLADTTVTANCVDPGFNVTGLGRELPFAAGLEQVLRTLRVGDPARGAGLIVDLATEARYAGRTGLYVTEKRRRELVPVDPATDAAAQDELWRSTEQLLRRLSKSPA